MISFESKIGTIRVHEGKIKMPDSWLGGDDLLSLYSKLTRRKTTVSTGDSDWMIAYSLWRKFGGELPKHPMTDENLIY